METHPTAQQENAIGVIFDQFKLWNSDPNEVLRNVDILYKQSGRDVYPLHNLGILHEYTHRYIWWYKANRGVRECNLVKRGDARYTDTLFMKLLKTLYQSLKKVVIFMCIKSPNAWTVMDLADDFYGPINHSLDNYRVATDPGNDIYNVIYRYIHADDASHYIPTDKAKVGNRVESILAMISMVTIGRVVFNGQEDDVIKLKQIIEDTRTRMNVLNIGSRSYLREIDFDTINKLRYLNIVGKQGYVCANEISPPKRYVDLGSDVWSFSYFFYAGGWCPKLSVSFVYLSKSGSKSAHMRIYLEYPNYRPRRVESVIKDVSLIDIFLPYPGRSVVTRDVIYPLVSFFKETFDNLTYEAGYIGEAHRLDETVFYGACPDS